MRIIGGILSIIGGIVAVVSGILLATAGSDSGIAVLLLGVVATAGGACAVMRWTYVLALIGAICVVVAKFFFGAEWIFFILGIPSLILIIRSRKDFGKASAVPESCPKCGMKVSSGDEYCSSCGAKLVIEKH